eukprot:UN31512
MSMFGTAKTTTTDNNTESKTASLFDSKADTQSTSMFRSSTKTTTTTEQKSSFSFGQSDTQSSMFGTAKMATTDNADLFGSPKTETTSAKTENNQP